MPNNQIEQTMMPKKKQRTKSKGRRSYDIIDKEQMVRVFHYHVEFTTPQHLRSLGDMKFFGIVQVKRSLGKEAAGLFISFITQEKSYVIGYVAHHKNFIEMDPDEIIHVLYHNPRAAHELGLTNEEVDAICIELEKQERAHDTATFGMKQLKDRLELLHRNPNDNDDDEEEEEDED